MGLRSLRDDERVRAVMHSFGGTRSVPETRQAPPNIRIANGRSHSVIGSVVPSRTEAGRLRPGSVDRNTTWRGIDERMPCQQGQLGLSIHQLVAVGRTPVR